MNQIQSLSFPDFPDVGTWFSFPFGAHLEVRAILPSRKCLRLRKTAMELPWACCGVSCCCSILQLNEMTWQEAPPGMDNLYLTGSISQSHNEGNLSSGEAVSCEEEHWDPR